MALPTSGKLSILDIVGEFGGTAPHSLSEYYSAAQGVPSSGQLSISDFYGAASLFIATISSNQNNVDLRSFALNEGWDGNSAVEITIESGVIVDSHNTSDPALVVDGDFPDDLTIINQGTIVGMGGDGGGENNDGPGEQGGTALSIVSTNIMGQLLIDNLGTIAGGGGGGGMGGGPRSGGSGSGGGGGQSSRVNSAGGIKRLDGANDGEPGTFDSPGQGGEESGEQVSSDPFVFDSYGAGGDGGPWGTAGEQGEEGGRTDTILGFFRTTTNPGLSGGAAGIAVTGFNDVTWVNEGTILGPTE